MYTCTFPPLVDKEYPMKEIDISLALKRITTEQGAAIIKQMFVTDYRDRKLISDLIEDIENITVSLYWAANPTTGLHEDAIKHREKVSPKLQSTMMMTEMKTSVMKRRKD